MLQPLRHAFTILQRSCCYELTQFLRCLGPRLRVFASNKALQGHTIRQERPEVPQAIGFAGIILRNEAAERNASKGIEVFKDRIENLATHIVKVDVDARRREKCT